MKCTAAFNIGPSGHIEIDGDHAPGVSFGSWDDIGISCSKYADGKYLISGNGISWPDGWKATIYQDENGQNTVWLTLSQNNDGLTVETFDPSDKITPIDIVHLLTLRVACEYSV